ncbi:MAG: 30S ribosomal protein S1 [Gemmatimonadota bacterium]|nr:30S ribosomal protein S1 [Gemmatimonadota bacterium]MDH5551073.1 30S ribosomal protein S1 [Gemmatimonadota bacterium]
MTQALRSKPFNPMLALHMLESVSETSTPPSPPQPSSTTGSSTAQAFPVRQDLYDEGYSDAEYQQMLELYEGTLQSIQEGEIVKSKILRVTESHVILDVGFKSEGAVAIDEFKDLAAVSPGDEVEVLLERLEDEEGSIVLSKKKADFMRVWEKIRHAYENDQPVDGTLQKKIKGGVVVDLMGVDAFLPGSQIALRRVPNIDELLGQTYQFKIIKLNKRRRNIVVSRRVILETERSHKREHLMKELEVGQVRKGVVKNITDFGAFIDLGGVDGLLHITDMSWGRVSHPSEMANLGQDIDVKVLDIDWDRERISLGLKQLQPYPWENVTERYPVGVRVQGKVVSITNYGAFVELEPGIEGLVHISEMSWTRSVRHPSKIVSIGETIEAVVLKVDPEEEKISLGMKQTEQDPWMMLPMKYPVGTRISGKVRNLTSFGAFVEIEPGIDGLIHISDMSWTKRVQHPSEIVKKNDTVEVVILNIDPENKRISLGLKQMIEDPWLKIAETHPVDMEIDGTIVRYQDNGIVVDLGGDLEGFVPQSQLPIPDGKSAESVTKVRQSVSLKVLEVDPIHHRIILAATEFGELPPDEPEPPPTEASSDDESDAPEAVTAESEDQPEAEAQEASEQPEKEPPTA